ncbi:methyl-accepting chemotaxis protein [Photobacterium ganghwense]|uniref:Histidine kinase n=1 Tax=Photobacterium ganghwense TaxID=320778 RepID=A0A0J1JW20_9GAMM|nr:methyl-accepting chemotaxis protein [Photobacterium ganghwense]KLV06497.1 histidine kinase [Photobacterium ganghwense]PSU06618.1 methyl-accepting chemotaxis protein [Photobacterium ganghwense]QSV14541.1 methyl-accepting chemotaxis protein [Photobacterium ganghwense]
MKIKHKLVGLTVLSAVALTAVLFMSWLANEQVVRINQSVTTVSEMEVSLLNLRRNEKDFLMRMDTKYRTRFEENLANFQVLEQSLLQDVRELDLALPEQSTLTSAMQSYATGMMNLIAAYQQLGLSHEQGMLKTFFASASALVNAAGAYPEHYDTVFRLTLAGKMLVLDASPQNADEFQTLLTQLQPRLMPAMGTAFTQYEMVARRVLDQLRMIGLDHNSGLRGEIRSYSHQVESTFAGLKTHLREEVVTAQRTTVTATLAAVVLVVIALLVLSGWISRSIQQRLSSLGDLMREIAASHDLRKTADTQGNDELADIAANFNYLLANLRKLIGEVQTAITELGPASVQLQQRSQDSEQAMLQQQGETDSVATAITEMGVTIRDIAANTETAAANADNCYRGAEAGLAEVSATKQQIGVLSQDLSQASDEVASLSTLSDNIGSVLDVIKAIAEQTNLLALNAAIEAARAGEQGRGFAVVADEVRSLALRTRQSTEEITTIIGSLQGQTDQVVEHINRCRSLGESSVCQADSAELKIQQIMADIQQIMDTSTQIATAVEQQSMVSEEIGQNVTAIRDITSLNSTVAHENAQAAEAVASQAHGLEKAIEVYRV